MRIIGRRRRDSDVPLAVPVEPDDNEPGVVIIDDRVDAVDRIPRDQSADELPADQSADESADAPLLEGPRSPVPSALPPADTVAGERSELAGPAEPVGSMEPAEPGSVGRSDDDCRGEEGVDSGRSQDGEQAEASAAAPTEIDAGPPVEFDDAPSSKAALVEAPADDRAETDRRGNETTSAGMVRRSGISRDASAGTLDPSDGRSVSTFRPLPRVIAVANQKGGVGKTTTTVNLGAALADLGFRTLVVDLDPQGNATSGLGIEARNVERSMYDVMMHDTPLEDCIEPTSVRNLFVAPATIDLAGVEIELVPMFSRELRLRRAVDAVLEDFDFILIDCPPSLGLITVNGLAAASEVLVPIQCEYYALEGLGQLLRNVHLVASNLNDRLEVSAFVLTMYDARTRLAEEVANDVREHFGSKVCNIVIPRTVRLSEAPSFGQPITVFDPSSRGAVAYRELAKEVSNGAAQRVG